MAYLIVAIIAEWVVWAVFSEMTKARSLRQERQ